MQSFPFGTLVKEMRQRKHISQEELSEGICSVSSLSRIENGLQNPTITTARLFMERLSEIDCFFFGFSSVNEQSLNRLQRDVLSDIENHSLSKFHEYQQLNLKKTTKFALQRDLLIQASAKELCDAPNPDDYIKALEVTLPLNDLINQKKRFYMYEQEIIILLNIARTLSISRKYETAQLICGKLYDYTKLNSCYEHLFPLIKHSLCCINEKNEQDMLFMVAPTL